MKKALKQCGKRANYIAPHILSGSKILEVFFKVRLLYVFSI
jgi:hypothetical protein